MAKASERICLLQSWRNGLHNHFGVHLVRSQASDARYEAVEYGVCPAGFCDVLL